MLPVCSQDRHQGLKRFEINVNAPLCRYCGLSGNTRTIAIRTSACPAANKSQDSYNVEIDGLGPFMVNGSIMVLFTI
jgi:hypothetical protein